MINELYKVKNLINEIDSIKSNCHTTRNDIKFLQNEHIHNLNKKITTNIYKFIILFLLVAMFFNRPFLIFTNLLLFIALYFFTFRIVPNIPGDSDTQNIAINIYIFLMVILIFRLMFKLGINITSTSILILLVTIILNKLIIPFITLTFFSNVIEKIDNSKKIYDLEEKLTNLSNRLNFLESQLNNSYIPYKYRNLHAINFFIDCLNNKRADTLKELVNLYENELRYQKDKEEYRNDMNSIKQEIQKTKKIANEAKSDARRSLFIARFK